MCTGIPTSRIPVSYWSYDLESKTEGSYIVFMIQLHSIFRALTKILVTGELTETKSHTAWRNHWFSLISMDTESAKSLISVSQILGYSWNFTFVGACRRFFWNPKLEPERAKICLEKLSMSSVQIFKSFNTKNVSKNIFLPLELNFFGIFSSGDNRVMTLPTTEP